MREGSFESLQRDLNYELEDYYHHFKKKYERLEFNIDNIDELNFLYSTVSSLLGMREIERYCTNIKSLLD